MNLVIADCEEFRRVKTRNKRPTAPGAPPAPDIESEEKRLLGLIILRGSNIVSTTIEGPPPSDPSARLGTSTGGSVSALTTGPGVSRPIGRGAPAPGLMGPAPGLGRPPGMGGPPPGFGAPGSMPPGFVPTPGGPSPFAPRKFLHALAFVRIESNFFTAGFAPPGFPPAVSGPPGAAPPGAPGMLPQTPQTEGSGSDRFFLGFGPPGFGGPPGVQGRGGYPPGFGGR